MSFKSIFAAHSEPTYLDRSVIFRSNFRLSRKYDESPLVSCENRHSFEYRLECFERLEHLSFFNRTSNHSAILAITRGIDFTQSSWLQARVFAKLTIDSSTNLTYSVLTSHMPVKCGRFFFLDKYQFRFTTCLTLLWHVQNEALILRSISTEKMFGYRQLTLANKSSWNSIETGPFYPELQTIQIHRLIRSLRAIGWDSQYSRHSSNLTCCISPGIRVTECVLICAKKMSSVYCLPCDSIVCQRILIIPRSNKQAQYGLIHSKLSSTRNSAAVSFSHILVTQYHQIRSAHFI